MISAVSTPPIFGLIGEGPSDHAILHRILAGYFDDPSLAPNPLQPPPGVEGGWTQVLYYCGSDYFVGAFEFADYVIVQIDSDVCEDPGYEVSRRDANGVERSIDDLIDAIRERLVRAMGEAVYQRFRERILFAICVDSIECWLLPLFFQDGRRAKTTNCLGTLNQRLSATLGFSIDEKNKQIKYYQKILRSYPKRKQLPSFYQSNPSLSRSVAELETKVSARDAGDPE